MVPPEIAQIRGNAPVRILAGGIAADAERIIRSVGPLRSSQADQHAVIFVDVAESGFLEWLQSGGVMVLVVGIHSGPASISRLDIQHERRPERVGPATAVIPALRSSRRGSDPADRCIRRHAVLGVAEEQAVALAEAMIDPRLEAVRVVGRGAALNEIVGQITRRRIVRRRRIPLKKLLIGAKIRPGGSCCTRLRCPDPAASARSPAWGP